MRKLDSLDDNVIQAIAAFASDKDIGHMMQTNKRIYVTLKYAHALWRQRLESSLIACDDNLQSPWQFYINHLWQRHFVIASSLAQIQDIQLIFAQQQPIFALLAYILVAAPLVVVPSCLVLHFHDAISFPTMAIIAASAFLAKSITTALLHLLPLGLVVSAHRMQKILAPTNILALSSTQDVALSLLSFVCALFMQPHFHLDTEALAVIALSFPWAICSERIQSSHAVAAHYLVRISLVIAIICDDVQLKTIATLFFLLSTTVYSVLMTVHIILEYKGWRNLHRIVHASLALKSLAILLGIIACRHILSFFLLAAIELPLLAKLMSTSLITVVIATTQIVDRTTTPTSNAILTNNQSWSKIILASYLCILCALILNWSVVIVAEIVSWMIWAKWIPNFQHNGHMTLFCRQLSQQSLTYTTLVMAFLTALIIIDAYEDRCNLFQQKINRCTIIARLNEIK